MDISKSPSNAEWRLVSTSVQRHVEYYPCCAEPYPDVTYIVQLKRREGSYWMNFIFPGIFLTGNYCKRTKIIAFVVVFADWGLLFNSGTMNITYVPCINP